MPVIHGTIATHNKKPFAGHIEVNDKTGLIAGVKKGAHKNPDHTFDKDCLIFPGMGDVHVHAREDQTGEQKHKEEYRTMADAALNGGCTFVAAMPNTPQPVTTKSDFSWHRNRVTELGHTVTILNYLGIDRNTKPLGKPGQNFYKLYFGKSVGDLTVTYAGELDEILAKYKGHNISFHVEYEPIIQAHALGETHSDRRPVECVNEALRLVLPLIEKHKIKAKLCHWTTGGESFELITAARKRGVDITLEVSPLHLIFDTAMADKDPSLWLKIQMNPAIQSPEHHKALIQALRDDVINIIATDHAPHTEEEKCSAFAKFEKDYPGLSNIAIAQKIKQKDRELFLDTCKENGMSGAPWLDVYGIVAGWLMHKHNFSPQDIARVTSLNPGAFVNPFLARQFPKGGFGKGFGQITKGFAGNLTVLNTKKPCTVSRAHVKSKVGWSPLEGVRFPTSVEAVFVRGKKVR